MEAGSPHPHLPIWAEDQGSSPPCEEGHRVLFLQILKGWDGGNSSSLSIWRTPPPQRQSDSRAGEPAPGQVLRCPAGLIFYTGMCSENLPVQLPPHPPSWPASLEKPG